MNTPMKVKQTVVKLFVLVIAVGLFSGCHNRKSDDHQSVLRSETFPDGSRVEYLENGGRRESRPFGKSCVYYDEGVDRVEFLADGTRIEYASNGAKFVEQGTTAKWYRSDGSLKSERLPGERGRTIYRQFDVEDELGTKVKVRTTTSYDDSDLKNVVSEYESGKIHEMVTVGHPERRIRIRTDFPDGSVIRQSYHSDGERLRTLESIDSDHNSVEVSYLEDGYTVSRIRTTNWQGDGPTYETVIEEFRDEKGNPLSRRTLRIAPRTFGMKSSEDPKVRHVDISLRTDGTFAYRQTWYSVSTTGENSAAFHELLGKLEIFDSTGQTVEKEYKFYLDEVTPSPVIRELCEFKEGGTTISKYGRKGHLIDSENDAIVLDQFAPALDSQLLEDAYGNSQASEFMSQSKMMESDVF